MNDYHGEERRKDDPWREQMEERMTRMEGAVSCIKRHGEEFNEMYGSILKETLEARATRAKLWAVATEELVRKGIWAALLVLGAAVLLGSKEYLKRWLTL
jgi:uncharacterized protein YabN with tetrapyrrole methylase and pyrophosphatase domain